MQLIAEFAAIGSDVRLRPNNDARIVVVFVQLGCHEHDTSDSGQRQRPCYALNRIAAFGAFREVSKAMTVYRRSGQLLEETIRRS